MAAMPSSPYKPFHPEWRARFRKVMSERRFNARSLAQAAQLGESTVSEWLNPKKLKTPSFESLAKAASVLGVSLDLFTEDSEPSQILPTDIVTPTAIAHADLIGELRAGVWREPTVDLAYDNTVVPIVPHPDFANVKQYAWRVIGDSMNKVAKHGSYVVGVSFMDVRHWRPLQNQDMVVCERVDGDKREYTLKRATRSPAGFYLRSESDDPAYKEVFWLPTDLHSEDETVTATHLVIGGYQVFL